MATQDRSSEFFNLCQSLPPGPAEPSNQSSASNTGSTQSSGRYGNTNDPNDELRTFHKTASALSKEIYSTSTLLSKLTALIQSRSGSLFVDETSNVNNLVLRIKTNIESLNMKLDAANDLIERNKRRLGRNSQAGMEASNLVGQLQEEFVNTTKGFKDVLRARSDRIKERTDRESNLLGADDNDNENTEKISLLGNKPKVYGQTPAKGGVGSNAVGSFGSNGLQSGGLNSFGAGGGMGMDGPRLDLTSAMKNQMPVGESTNQLPRPYGIRQDEASTGMRLRHSNSINNDSSNHDSSLPVYTPLDIQRMEEQSGQTQAMQLIPDQNYLRERADAMSAVETNIVELGTIFNKLAVMVNEHSEMVQRVEDNVDNATDNITLSMNTLTDTLHDLRSNRQLFFRLLGVLVVFVIFFITFFA